MERDKIFWKSTLETIWGVILQNVAATVISLGSVIFLTVLNSIESVQKFIRTIPTDYILIPFLILIIFCLWLIYIYRKQKATISDLAAEPSNDISEDRMITHYGVWWKISPDIEFIEDFPYCVCCDPHIKLVQTEWHPDEEFECPITKTEYKLYDGVPREREKLLDALRQGYFGGLTHHFIMQMRREINRLQELHPDMSDRDLALKIFEISPFDNIPQEERDKILDKHPEAMNAVDFVDRHFHNYKQYLKRF